MEEKHALNPPIVTVIGAGIAGLTAAHELVERGFLVQVVEAEEDPYNPGSPLVGGMAANQPARVRANIEDLHSDLLAVVRDEVVTDEKPESDRRKLSKHLLELFAFNRRSWLTTEFPARVRRVLFSKPDEDVGFTNSVIEDLKNARRRFRDQWLWDLSVRSVLAGDIATAPAAHPTPTPELLELAHKGWRDLIKLAEEEGSGALGKKLHSFGRFPPIASIDITGLLDDLIAPALEREFLCFRLVPRFRSGLEDAPANARTLFSLWAKALKDALGACCMSDPSQEKSVEVIGMEPIMEPHSGAMSQVWVEIQIIELRLPGEHGFRFFPSFYRHIDDTMQRIPLFDGDRATGRTVLDNLNPTMSQGIGFSHDDKEKLDDRNRRQLERLRNAELVRQGRDTPENREKTGMPTPGVVGWNNSDRFHKRRKGREEKKNRDEHALPPATVVELHRDMPRSAQGFRDRTDRLVRRLGGTPRDAVLLFAKLFRFMTTSVGSSRVDLQACKLEYSIVSPK